MVVIIVQSILNCTVRYQIPRWVALIVQWIGIVCLKPPLDIFSTVCVAVDSAHRIHQQTVAYRANQMMWHISVIVSVIDVIIVVVKIDFVVVVADVVVHDNVVDADVNVIVIVVVVNVIIVIVMVAVIVDL